MSYYEYSNPNILFLSEGKEQKKIRFKLSHFNYTENLYKLLASFINQKWEGDESHQLVILRLTCDTVEILLLVEIFFRSSLG